MIGRWIKAYTPESTTTMEIAFLNTSTKTWNNDEAILLSYSNLTFVSSDEHTLSLTGTLVQDISMVNFVLSAYIIYSVYSGENVTVLLPIRL